MTHIDETVSAKGYTPAAQCAAVFGRPRTLDGIVIHHWGALGQSHEGVVDFFVNGPGQTSAHFVVSAGKITCLVSPSDVAWHSGNAVGNASTIGIECRPEATAADYATVAELVDFLRTTYGPLPLSPHRQWQQTACPGVWDLPRIDRLAAARTARPVPPKGPFMALTDQQQAQLLNDVAFIKSELEGITVGTGPAAKKVRFRDFFVAGVRASQEARDRLRKP